MIDDPSHPLVRALEGTTEDVVYLPPIVRLGGPEKSETVAARPDVAALAASYFGSTDRLHGDKVSDVTIQNEKPIHRMMIYLHAQGATAREIAERTGYTYQLVNTVLRQPWARQRLVQILNETSKDHVKHFLSTEISPSLEVLREVRDNPDAKEMARLTAANAILDRALGKPTVHVESNNRNSNTSIPAEVARLDADLATVRKLLSEKGQLDGPSTNN